MFHRLPGSPYIGPGLVTANVYRPLVGVNMAPNPDELREQKKKTADFLWFAVAAGVRDEILSLEVTELVNSDAPVACQTADETVFEASVSKS